MSIDYRLCRKNKAKNSKYIRHSKKQKDLDCIHLPMRFARGYGSSLPKVFHVIDRWLISQVGKPVDKVFSKFCEEFKDNDISYSPREEFNRHIVYNREECTKYKRLYVANGILNLEKPHKIKPKSYPYNSTPQKVVEQVNKGLGLIGKKQLSALCDKAPIKIGRYYSAKLREYHYNLSSVYLVSLEDWNKVEKNKVIGEDLEFLLHCERCKIPTGDCMWCYLGVSTIWGEPMLSHEETSRYIFVRKIKTK